MSTPSRTSIPTERIADSIAAVEAMTLAQKEQMLDELFEIQPVILGNIVLLARKQLHLPAVDKAMELLLVITHCLRDELRRCGRFTEADFERCCEQNAQMWRFLDGERDADWERSLNMIHKSCPEPGLLAHLVCGMNDLGLDDPEVVLLMKSTLDLCIEARWGTGTAAAAGVGTPGRQEQG